MFDAQLLKIACFFQDGIKQPTVSLWQASSQTPICPFSFLNTLIWASYSQHPPLSFFFHPSQHAALSFFSFHVCILVCMIGPDFLLHFSRLSTRSPALPGCSLVKQTCLKSASWKAADPSEQPITSQRAPLLNCFTHSTSSTKTFLQAARSKKESFWGAD